MDAIPTSRRTSPDGEVVYSKHLIIVKSIDKNYRRIHNAIISKNRQVTTYKIHGAHSNDDESVSMYHVTSTDGKYTHRLAEYLVRERFNVTITAHDIKIAPLGVRRLLIASDNDTTDELFSPNGFDPLVNGIINVKYGFTMTESIIQKCKELLGHDLKRQTDCPIKIGMRYPVSVFLKPSSNIDELMINIRRELLCLTIKSFWKDKAVMRALKLMLQGYTRAIWVNVADPDVLKLTKLLREIIHIVTANPRAAAIEAIEIIHDIHDLLKSHIGNSGYTEKDIASWWSDAVIRSLMKDISRPNLETFINNYNTGGYVEFQRF